MANAYSAMSIERGRIMIESLLLVLWLGLKWFLILLAIDVALIIFFEVGKEIVKRRREKKK